MAAEGAANNQVNMITVLCIQNDSNYKKIPNLDLWDINRNAYNYTGNNIVIAHPPCQQWSKLRSFAKENKLEKDLAYFCLDQVNKNGGILEHPKGSLFIKEMRLNTVCVWQSWWGFPAKKETLLYVNKVKLLPTPLCFNVIEKKVENMNKNTRSKMTLEFCNYLINSALNYIQ